MKITRRQIRRIIREALDELNPIDVLSAMEEMFGTMGSEEDDHIHEIPTDKGDDAGGGPFDGSENEGIMGGRGQGNDALDGDDDIREIPVGDGESLYEIPGGAGDDDPLLSIKQKM